MRRLMLSTVVASLTFITAPVSAQNAPETNSNYIYNRTNALNSRINIAVADHKLSRRQANRLYMSVRRVQKSADAARDDDGSIDGDDADRLNQQLTDIERSLPPQN